MENTSTSSVQIKNGFTIIELVVVIAIIAVLAGIVLTNVTQYAKKGKDAAIKGQMSQIRTAATDFSYTAGTYSGMCPGTGVTACDKTESNIANLGGLFNKSNFGSTFYCISFYLSDHTNKWCVDNTGYAGSSDDCDSSPYSCQ
jgi:prepilin-type N-terminal cleavage/methylation domain-containing protein